MKLTRTQELALIDRGLKVVLDELTNGEVKRLPRGPYRKTSSKKQPKWSLQQRKKFSETMKKKWANKDK